MSRRRWPLLGQTAIPGIAADDAVRSAWISEDGLYRYTLQERNAR